MNVFLVLLIVIIVCVAFIFILSRLDVKGKDKKSSLVQFYAEGKDLGFSFKEIELLRRLAVKCSIDDPSVLFWSQVQLDSCIRSLIQSLRLSGNEQDENVQDFLAKLYDYRKKLEFDKPKIKGGLMSTRQITESQSLRILVSGVGVFQSHLIKNTSQYITIARPKGSVVPQNFSWSGQQMAVYFWRNDDAGYVFDSEVVDEVYSRGHPALKISHSETLFRTQKRKSVRMKTRKAAFLYLLGGSETSDVIETVPGLKCLLNDISDTGCSVTIGGKANAEMRVKIQFVLKTAPMILCGVVRSADYDGETNRSVLHIEADLLPRETRNEILGEIFGMQENEESLPSRILETDFENPENELIDGGPSAQVELHDLANNNL